MQATHNKGSLKKMSDHSTRNLASMYEQLKQKKTVPNIRVASWLPCFQSSFPDPHFPPENTINHVLERHTLILCQLVDLSNCQCAFRNFVRLADTREITPKTQFPPMNNNDAKQVPTIWFNHTCTNLHWATYEPTLIVSHRLDDCRDSVSAAESSAPACHHSESQWNTEYKPTNL